MFFFCRDEGARGRKNARPPSLPPPVPPSWPGREGRRKRAATTGATACSARTCLSQAQFQRRQGLLGVQKRLVSVAYEDERS